MSERLFLSGCQRSSCLLVQPSEESLGVTGLWVEHNPGKPTAAESLLGPGTGGALGQALRRKDAQQMDGPRDREARLSRTEQRQHPFPCAPLGWLRTQR